MCVDYEHSAGPASSTTVLPVKPSDHPSTPLRFLFTLSATNSGHSHSCGPLPPKSFHCHSYVKTGGYPLPPGPTNRSILEFLPRIFALLPGPPTLATTLEDHRLKPVLLGGGEEGGVKPPLREEAGVELEGGGEMLGEIGGIVAARVEVEFVGDAAGGEDFVEGGGTGVETVVVVVTAVEIDFQADEIGRSGENERAVLIPEGGIGPIAEDATENAGSGRA